MIKGNSSCGDQGTDYVAGILSRYNSGDSDITMEKSINMMVHVVAAVERVGGGRGSNFPSFADALTFKIWRLISLSI